MNGATIAFRVWGASRSTTGDVLLVHGGAANARWWDHVAPLLAADRRVVAIDLSGHGDSGHRPNYSVEGWADELAAVVNAAGLSVCPVVVGHSLGGLVTIALARRGVPALAGAVVVDSPLYNPGPRPSPFGAARVYPTETDVVARFRPVPAQPVLAWIATHIAATSARQVAGGWGWKFDPSILNTADDVPSTLDGLRCRAVLIAGEHGILSEQARRVLTELDNVAKVEIPDAWHAMMLDQPLSLLAALRGVLAGWESSSRSD